MGIPCLSPVVALNLPAIGQESNFSNVIMLFKKDIYDILVYYMGFYVKI